MKGLLENLQAVPSSSESQDGFFSPLYRYDRSRSLRPLAGLDEAGRGPLAGPLVAAAVILPEGFDSPQINDSKKLKASERQKAFELITAQALHWAFEVISPAEVDRLNPLAASLLAMARALAKLPQKPQLALVDGNQAPKLDCPVLTVVKGDATSLSIAAASILAKVLRDGLMLEAHARYPDYGFDRHKGYGTKEHLRALEKLGPCPIHRLTYRGVKKVPKTTLF